MTSAVAIHEEDAGILLVFVLLLTCVGPDLYLGPSRKIIIIIRQLSKFINP